MPEWDLSSIIDEKTQTEIEKLTVRQHTEKRISRFLCRIGWHKKTTWDSIGMMQMASVHEVTGEQFPVQYDLAMRVCMKCGSPAARLRKV